MKYKSIELIDSSILVDVYKVFDEKENNDAF